MNRCVIACLGLLLVFMISACGQDSGPVAGIYRAESPSGPIELILKDSGEGVWSSAADEISFKWSVDRQKLRLHTKAGGVIEGRLQQGAILVTLPGVGELQFQKTDA